MTPFTKILILSACALPLAAGSAGIAAAQEDPDRQRGPGRMLFELFDTNKDGSITREEYDAAREKLFTRMDYTKDGYLIGLEVRLFMRERIEARMKARFAAIDADKNGAISEAEWVAHQDARFKEIDADKDGKITRDELRRARGRGTRMGLGRGFRRADDDDDGAITAEEWKAAQTARFKRIDRDGDGSVTEDEIRQGFVRWAGRHGGYRSRGRPGRSWSGDGRRGMKRDGMHRGGRAHRRDADGERRGRHHRWHRGGGKRGWHHKRRHRGRAGLGRMFRTADANRDGRVSKQEFTEFTNRVFGWLDKDRNGIVTRNDLPTRGRPGRGRR